MQQPTASFVHHIGAWLLVGLKLFLIVSSVGCQTAAPTTTTTAAKQARADLRARSGSAVTGTVRFVEVDGRLRVTADVAGLSPGPHGFHVHETGDCSAPDASSAGAHFAGEGVVAGHALGPTHGLPDAPQRHAGDLGNLVAAADGTARLEHTDDVLTLEGPRSVIGRAVIVHETADDGADVASAGARIACGVITDGP